MTDRRSAGKVQYGDTVLRPDEYAYGQRFYRHAEWKVEKEGQGPRGGAPFMWSVYHPPTKGAFPLTRVRTLKEAAQFIDTNALEVWGDKDPDADWHAYLDDSALNA